MEQLFATLDKKLHTLSLDGLCIAFSGGVDSALLLFLAKKYRVHAITFASIFQSEAEILFCKDFCEEYGIAHTVLSFDPLAHANIATNPKDRCYHCKRLIFENTLAFAHDNNIQHVLDGTNFDDLSAYRPGLKALNELGIISPFAACGITKKHIRKKAQALGLSVHNKPSTPCFATRFPYGQQLHKHDIELIIRVEDILYAHGFAEHRARLHADILRIEIPKESFDVFYAQQTSITEHIKSLGIRYICLDLEGLRRGSMDMDTTLI